MTTFLETTIDKFTFRVAEDRFYSKDGLWILPMAASEATRVLIGVSDFLQQRSGDVAFSEMRPAGERILAGEEAGTIETVKITFSLASPVDGMIIERNPALEKTPEIINQDPYGNGWLIIMDVPDWDSQKSRLLSAEAYFNLMKEQAVEELNR